jgi:hypothetical protein
MRIRFGDKTLISMDLPRLAQVPSGLRRKAAFRLQASALAGLAPMIVRTMFHVERFVQV